MIRRILVPIPGPSIGPAAIEEVTSLASAHGAQVTALTAVDPALEHSPEAFVALKDMVARGMRLCAFERQAQQASSELEAACRAAAVPVAVVHCSAEFVDAICAQWRYHDLVVFPMRASFHPDVCADPEAALIRMIVGRVGPIVAPGSVARPVRRTLIAYSGSHASAKSMKRYVQMKLWPDAAIRLLHVSEDESAEGARLLDDAASYCRLWGFDVEPVVRQGPPAATLLAEAEAFNADLIVVGDSARSLISRKVLGDVMLQTIREARRAVFFAH